MRKGKKDAAGRRRSARKVVESAEMRQTVTSVRSPPRVPARAGAMPSIPLRHGSPARGRGEARSIQSASTACCGEVQQLRGERRRACGSAALPRLLGEQLFEAPEARRSGKLEQGRREEIALDACGPGRGQMDGESPTSTQRRKEGRTASTPTWHPRRYVGHRYEPGMDELQKLMPPPMRTRLRQRGGTAIALFGRIKVRECAITLPATPDAASGSTGIRGPRESSRTAGFRS